MEVVELESDNEAHSDSLEGRKLSIADSVAEIRKISESVRGYISTHSYQATLLKYPDKWNQICSSLDVIRDSLSAIESYHEYNYPDDTGLRYIYTYGFLQALFIQQDSLINLCDALGFCCEISSKMQNVRDIRNASVGHASKQGNKKSGFRHNYISRISMEKYGFDLLRYCGRARQHKVERVDLDNVCTDQMQEIIEKYRHLEQNIKAADLMHKNQFKCVSLVVILSKIDGYIFGKIAEGVFSGSGGDHFLCLSHLGMVKKAYEEFQGAVKERGDLNQDLEDELRIYLHAISKLDSYLRTNKAEEQADSSIYFYFIQNKHEEFLGIAREIDEVYQS